MAMVGVCPFQQLPSYGKPASIVPSTSRLHRQRKTNEENMVNVFLKMWDGKVSQFSFVHLVGWLVGW